MDNYFNHQELIKRFKLLAMKEIPNLRIFDRTVGLFYAKRINNGIINYVPIKINSNGMADCVLIYNTGKGFCVTMEAEFKSGNAIQTKDQINWKNFTEKTMGGKYFLIRDEHFGIKEIKSYLKVNGFYENM